ncbi:MAG: fimbrial protein [Mesorhizobium sp.]|nr:fimbrial protein [Mesorhizobium sp.]
MAGPLDLEQDEKPLDPAVEKVRRKLVRFVAVNLGLMFFDVMAVLVAVVYKSGVLAPAAPVAVSRVPGEIASGDIALPAGARVVSQSLSGERLSLHLALSGGGETILIYDTTQARIVGRYTLKAE